MAKAEATEVNQAGETVSVAPGDRHSQDKLQAELSMCLAAVHAVELLHSQEAPVVKAKGTLHGNASRLTPCVLKCEILIMVFGQDVGRWQNVTACCHCCVGVSWADSIWCVDYDSLP